MLKVLYIAPDYPSANNNAAQVRANQLLPRLARCVDLHVLGYSKTLTHSEVERPHFPVQIMKLRPPGLATIFSSNPRAYFRHVYPKAVDVFITMLKNIRPDIVHFDSIATFGLFEMLRRMELESPPKVVIHPHDAVSRLYASRIGAERNFMRRQYLTMQQRKIMQVERLLYPEAALCLVDSLQDADFLSSLTQTSNVIVLPLGFDESEFHPDRDSICLNHPNVVLSGAMGGVASSDAAQRLCKRIMPLVWRKIPSMHAYLVGSSPTPEILELQRDKRIHVTGFVDDLAAYLRASDIYVCPLVLGSGMKTRIIEALACGCALVTSPEGVVGIGVNSTMQDNAWMIAQNDNEFAEYICKLISDPPRRAMLARAAIEISSPYSWSEIARKLALCYRSLVL